MKPNYYAVIPAPVRYCEALKPAEKLLYGEIASLCNAEGYCWADNAYFAQLYSCDEKTVSRWISNLANRGFLFVKVYKKEGNKRKIYVADPTQILTKPSDENVTTYLPKSHYLVTKKSLPSDEKVTSIYENNKINNKTNRESEQEFSSAFEFLQSKSPIDLNVFKAKFKSKIPNLNEVIDDFNCKVVEEQLEWIPKVLMARLNRLAQNWLRNGQFNKNGSAQPANQVQPAYMKKPLK